MNAHLVVVQNKYFGRDYRVSRWFISFLETFCKFFLRFSKRKFYFNHDLRVFKHMLVEVFATFSWFM